MNFAGHISEKVDTTSWWRVFGKPTMSGASDNNSGASIVAMIERARMDNRHEMLIRRAHCDVMVYAMGQLDSNLPNNNHPPTAGAAVEVAAAIELLALEDFDQVLVNIDHIAHEAKQEAVLANFPLAIGLASLMYAMVDAGRDAYHENTRLFGERFTSNTLPGDPVVTPASVLASPAFRANIEQVVHSIQAMIAPIAPIPQMDTSRLLATVQAALMPMAAAAAIATVATVNGNATPAAAARVLEPMRNERIHRALEAARAARLARARAAGPNIGNNHATTDATTDASTVEQDD